jgi:hypothetical protein
MVRFWHPGLRFIVIRRKFVLEGLWRGPIRADPAARVMRLDCTSLDGVRLINPGNFADLTQRIAQWYWSI